jgi:hypothetical protein
MVYPGVENIPDTELSIAESNYFISLLENQIRNQAYIENRATTANRMFSFGYRWARIFPNAGELSKQVNKGPRPDRAYLNAYNDGIYGYFKTDQNYNPIPPLSELQPIIDFIEDQLGIDMKDYDSMLGNIYENNSFIHQHRDTSESRTAENYPVIVINLGACGGLMFDKLSSDKDLNSTEAYKEFEAALHYTNYADRIGLLPIQNGGIYAFGVNGINRFTFNHRIVDGISKCATKPIMVPVWDNEGNKTAEKELTKYRITLTFRRSLDLTEDVPKTPNRFKQPIIKEPIIRKGPQSLF